MVGYRTKNMKDWDVQIRGHLDQQKRKFYLTDGPWFMYKRLLDGDLQRRRLSGGPGQHYE